VFFDHWFVASLSAGEEPFHPKGKNSVKMHPRSNRRLTRFRRKIKLAARLRLTRDGGMFPRGAKKQFLKKL
jgi:hypothetical protein